MYLKVIATTGAKKEALSKKSKDSFNVSVREKAERNMANRRIVEIIADYLKVSANKVRIINGHRHPHKLLFVDDGKN